MKSSALWHGFHPRFFKRCAHWVPFLSFFFGWIFPNFPCPTLWPHPGAGTAGSGGGGGGQFVVGGSQRNMDWWHQGWHGNIQVSKWHPAEVRSQFFPATFLLFWICSKPKFRNNALKKSVGQCRSVPQRGQRNFVRDRPMLVRHMKMFSCVCTTADHTHGSPVHIHTHVWTLCRYAYMRHTTLSINQIWIIFVLCATIMSKHSYSGDTVRFSI